MEGQPGRPRVDLTLLRSNADDVFVSYRRKGK